MNRNLILLIYFTFLVACFQTLNVLSNLICYNSPDLVKSSRFVNKFIESAGWYCWKMILIFLHFARYFKELLPAPWRSKSSGSVESSETPLEYGKNRYVFCFCGFPGFESVNDKFLLDNNSFFDNWVLSFNYYYVS